MPKILAINLRDSLYNELDKEAKKKYQTVADLVENLAVSYIKRIKALKKRTNKKVTAEKLITKNKRIFR